jgi:hypothetical protein
MQYKELLRPRSTTDCKIKKLKWNGASRMPYAPAGATGITMQYNRTYG